MKGERWNIYKLIPIDHRTFIDFLSIFYNPRVIKVDK